MPEVGSFMDALVDAKNKQNANMNTVLLDVINDPMKGKLDLYDKTYANDEIPGLVGTHSLFNHYTVFSLFRVGMGSQTDQYNADMHFDIKKDMVDPNNYESRLDPKLSQYDFAYDHNFTPKISRTPTAQEIIQYSKVQGIGTASFGPVPYAWNDFLYCKWYGRIPNNHLITLRRYFVPIHDNAKDPDGKPLLPTAQAVTWLGEEAGNKISDVLKFTYGLVWKEIESQVQSVDGNEVGNGAGVESLGGTGFVSKLGTALTVMRGSKTRWSGQAEKEVEWSKKAWTDDGPYWNQVYGPVNVVHKTHMRDRGMKFDNTIKLKFEYSVRSYSGINPKVAMLDLMTNFWILTYNNAKFWGGATRYFPNYKDSVGFFGSQSAFYSGNWTEYFKNITGELENMMGAGADFLQKLFSGGSQNLMSMIKGMVGTGADLMFGKMAAQTRPHMLSIRSLLSGNPVGEWHLTVGNPLNPIAVMGNMLIDSTEMHHGDILGADDFPTEVTFIVTLKHGRPRDKADIESMFNLGGGQITYAPTLASSTEMNTFSEKARPAANASDAEKAKWQQDRNAEFVNIYSKLDVSSDTTPQGNSRARIRSQWGTAFGSNDNLAFVFGRTRAKF